ncbi:MAG: 30S ribosomal protein S20, partial [Gammaproteobacteria bacterium]
MANSAQSKKRARQAERRRLHNRGLRSNMRTTIKKFQKLVEAGDKEAAASAYRETTSVVDKMTSKGIHHKNRAARMKS